ncbi:hypothetical protein Tco_0921385 [Tanacetum coccineum]
MTLTKREKIIQDTADIWVVLRTAETPNAGVLYTPKVAVLETPKTGVLDQKGELETPNAYPVLPYGLAIWCSHIVLVFDTPKAGFCPNTDDQPKEMMRQHQMMYLKLLQFYVLAAFVIGVFGPVQHLEYLLAWDMAKSVCFLASDAWFLCPLGLSGEEVAALGVLRDECPGNVASFRKSPLAMCEWGLYIT